MMGKAPRGPVSETWRMSGDALWDEWVLAEMGAELALFLWRTAAVDERGVAYQEYVRALRHETHVAGLLARIRPSEEDVLVSWLPGHPGRLLREATSTRSR